jgi:G3E family GTPase
MAPTPGILLTVIGGYLGAGKTTLLNHVLRDAGDRRLAVLVNDFGAINIDAELIESREGEMLSLTNGCICCGIGGDFIAALARLRDVDDPPEQVVVEASGVADPTQIAIFGDMPGYVRDAVVVVADAETVRARAEDEHTGHQVLAQLRAADLLVINKTDLVEPAALAELRVWLRSIAGPSTSIVDASFGNVPTDVLIGARVLAPSGERPAAHARHPAAHGEANAEHRHHDHDHAAHPSYDTWSADTAGPLSGAALVEALEALPDGIVRAKGILQLREDLANRYLLQLVGRRYSIAAIGPWGDEPPSSRLVVIGLPGCVDAGALDATLAQLTSAVPAGG